MYILFVLMGLAAIFIAIGLYHKLSASFFFLSYTYVFLIDKAQYNNHYYLVSLFAFFLIFTDSHHTFSIDSWRKKFKGHAPYWNVFLLRSQMFIVYFFGGIAKLNSDWLKGEPMRHWLGQRSDMFLIGKYFVEEWAVYLFTYGGLLFDLSIGFLLLWRRTRLFGFILVVFFNFLNNQLFSIGIFTYMAVAATILFTEVDWPRNTLNKLGKALKVNKGSILYLPSIGTPKTPKINHKIIAFVLIFLLIQIIFPLRHFIIPGDPSWTEEGHNFAWHMKLRDKDADSVSFFAKNPQTGEAWEVDIKEDLNSRQRRKMSSRPHMIIQYAHYLRDKMEAKGIENPIIKADVQVSLNGRPPQHMIDPNANLAEEEYSYFTHNYWITQLPTGLAIGNYD